MNWEEVGAIGQVLGSVAVFVTLGYLAVQVRHARSEARRSTTENRAAVARQLLLLQVTDERLNKVYMKTMDGGSTERAATFVGRMGLSDAEAKTYDVFQVVWWQYRAGVINRIDDLPSGEKSAFDATLRLSYQPGGVAHVWYEANKSLPHINPDAVRYIDNVLARPG